MIKIQGSKIVQIADEMQNVTGTDVKLTSGEDVLIKDLDIFQDAKSMKNVKGLNIDVSGSQSAKLEGVHIKQPNAELIISDDPNVDVRINVQN